ncbi:branched-chain amino acid transport system II carrier protein [Ascidiimonas aurantiaca]|uniref:branched-chain amino acid transport system II carrier protein n=1 Tax=Ascidiimonas aurantiaca TaxID=1685432 RepID=UPI0030EBFBFB
MNKTKETFIIGFALFSLFFGAGNLILPPLLGFKGGTDWFLVSIGFALSGVVLPILAIWAHARLQGTMYDFAKKVSPLFSLLYCLVVYLISVSLPAPRTASVTHEMAVEPFLGTHSLITSSVYFALVLLFALNRSKVLDILGKALTPMIIGILLFIIGIGFYNNTGDMRLSQFDVPLISGLLEGYQTFDAIGGVVVGGVIIISLQLKGLYSFEEKKKLIARAGILAGAGLLLIYTGLILTGALYSDVFPGDISRTELLTKMSLSSLGSYGTAFLSVLVALACFTTAVGIITGTADFMKSLLGNSQRAYTATAVLACILGVLMGQLDVHYIIDIALPALMFIYPVTIVLILLNVLPPAYASPIVFKLVTLTALIFSIPHFISSVGFADLAKPIETFLPLGTYYLGWLIPSIVMFIVSNLMKRPGT